MGRQGESGYTLVELLVVIAIIGLIVAIAAPATSDMINAAEFRADARRVEASLRKCQYDAIAGQHTIIVSTQAELFAVEEASSDSTLIAFETPIRWFADGTTSGGKVVIQREERTKTITVAWLTGTVTSE